LTFLEIYRDSHDDPIFHFSGYKPQVKPARIAGAKKHQMMNALVCTASTSLLATDSGMIMSLDGRPITWKVISTADKAILIPAETINLRPDRNYEILKTEDGQMHLRQL
jgi:hypothetical protein